MKTEDVLESAATGAKTSFSKPVSGWDENSVRLSALNLVRRSRICMLGTHGEDGLINIRSLLSLKHRGLKKIWFSTNTSSRKVDQIKRDNHVCVYYVDEKTFEGLMLNGTIGILRENYSRAMLWSEGSEVYYPLGVDDPDYTVLSFTVRQANYYHGLKTLSFMIT